MGALIVVGDGPEVLNICSGGFLLDAAFSPQRLSELAKMDGAIILAPDASRIARANVHLVPNPNVPTSETGTRHRTAERVARSIDVPVISVSEDLGIIAVYVGDQKHPLENIPRLLNRSNQALQTLERYRNRLEEVSANLSALEVEDFVSLRDVALLLQRTEMVMRIAEEIDEYVVELGADGRLVRLQLEEVLGGVGRRAPPRRARLPPRRQARGVDRGDGRAGRARHRGAGRPQGGGRRAAPARGQPAISISASSHAATACCRASPAYPSRSSTASSTSFGNLSKIMRATIDDLDDVEGVGETRARAIKEGLVRLAESSLLDRFG